MLIYNYHAVFTARDIVMEPSYDGALLHAWQSGSRYHRPFKSSCVFTARNILMEPPTTLRSCIPCSQEMRLESAILNAVMEN